VSKPVWNSEIRKFKVGHHPENFGTYGTSQQNKLLAGGIPTPLKNISQLGF
jgi:hypothetical protein